MDKIKKVMIGYLLVLSLLILEVGCRSREADLLTISGEIKGIPEGIVRLYTYPPSNLLLDTCEIRDGKYQLKARLKEAQIGMLYFDVKPEYQQNFYSMVRLFLAPVDMEIYSDRENMKTSLKVKNNPLNDRLIACEKALKALPAYKEAGILNDSVQLAFYRADMPRVRRMSGQRDSLYRILMNYLFEYEPRADRSEVVAWLVSQYSSSMSGKAVEELVERFAPSFRTSYYVRQMTEFADRDKQLVPGKLFPDFKVFDKDGKTYTLRDFKGKYLFIEFSASWCGWCKKEIPHIRKAYKELKDKIVFITIMMDTDRKQWIQDQEKEDIRWLCLTDLKGMKASPLVEACNLRGLPDSFVVDPDGYILRRDLRGGEVLEFLSGL